MEMRNRTSNDRDIIIDVATERNDNIDLIKDERPKFKFDFSPNDFKDYIKSEKGLKSALGRKWKPNLKDIGRFAKMYQPITSKCNLSIAMNRKSIRAIICGLLAGHRMGRRIAQAELTRSRRY